MKYVIIGNSAAGIGAVEGIRHIDKEGEITIITSEAHHTYSRPLISYLLLGKVTREGIKYRNDNFYKDYNCKLLANTTVTNIDAAGKHAVLQDGQKISYDKLFDGLKGNRLMLRGVGLNEKELEILGIKHAGEEAEVGK